MTMPKNQEELDAIINKALAPRLEKITELEGQVTSLTTERDQAVTNATTATETISGLQGQLTAKDRELLVKDVAHKKGVAEKWLSGDTVEELEQSADDWLADARATLGVNNNPAPGNGNGDSGTPEPPVPDSKSGTVPSAGTGDETPDKPTYQERLQEAYEKAKRSGQEEVTI